MTYPTRAWIILCAALLALGCCAGYAVCDAQWTQRDTDRKLDDAKASRDLSEQYRIKERKLNETIGEIETRAINDAANAEMEYKAVIDRLLNAGNHPIDGLRIKPALTCRAVPNNTATPGNGYEEVQAGLSIETAGRIIGVGSECDQVVLSLDACQAYAESLQK
jgi:hypothetical protein